MPNYFIALVVVGAKEEHEVELAMGTGIFSEYVKELYQKTAFSAMGRWLMIEVKHKDILTDVKRLIEIRVDTLRSNYTKTICQCYQNSIPA
jgi:hypothetical protein